LALEDHGGKKGSGVTQLGLSHSGTRISKQAKELAQGFWPAEYDGAHREVMDGFVAKRRLLEYISIIAEIREERCPSHRRSM
jgi:hypothetical protein